MSFVRFSFLAVALTAATLRAQEPVDSLPRVGVGRQALGDSILSVGAMAGWMRQDRGYAVGTLDTKRDDLDRAPSLPLALQGRLPGVSVSQGQGFLGSSSRLWLRGPSSLMVNEPLLIIDGVRTHSAQPYFFFGERVIPSRLEDLDPDIIERVEVLRGAAAAAMHGPGTSKGVILVTTKRGQEGRARWSGFAESGPMMEVTDFPANFGTLGVTPTGAPVGNCPLAAQAAGTCTATTRRSWNPLESASPFRTGWNTGAGLAVSGGSPALTYRASAGHDRATGVYTNDHGNATNAHLNLGMAATPSLDVRLVGAYRTETLRHPTTDYIQFGLLGEAVDDPVRRGYGFFGQSPVERGRQEEDGHRITAGLTAVWRPRSWLRASAVVGYDELNAEHDFRERDGQTPSDSFTVIDRSKDKPTARTAGIEVDGTGRFLGAVARSAIGIEYLRDDDRGSTFAGVIPDDPLGPRGESSTFIDWRRVTTGVYVQQHLGWQRLFVTGSLRADLPKGDEIANAYTPSVDVSWIAMGSGERAPRWIGDLRLRAAYARGGGLWVLTAEPGAPFAGLRPSRETAERMQELEVGADVTLLSGRVQTEITLYRATNDQGLVEVMAPPSGGGGGQVFLSNDARFETSGIEASLDARLLEISRFTWDVGIGVAAHDHEVRHLPGPPSITGNGGQRLQEGDAIGEYHPGAYTYADANGDGLIAPSEITLSTGDAPATGSPFPKYEAALRTDATLGPVRLAAILDRRSGQKLYNLVGRLRCRGDAECEEQHDPATSLADQAAAIAGQLGRYRDWVEDASYTKLREVSVGVSLPRAWTRASTARLTVTGRNLFTWTSYRGLDPEIISEHRNTYLATGDFFQPPLRSYTARLDLVW